MFPYLIWFFLRDGSSFPPLVRMRFWPYRWGRGPRIRPNVDVMGPRPSSEHKAGEGVGTQGH